MPTQPKAFQAFHNLTQITRKQKETETGNASLSQVYWMCLKSAHTMCFCFLASVYSSAKSTVNSNNKNKKKRAAAAASASEHQQLEQDDLRRWNFYFEFIAEFIGRHCINLNLPNMEEFSYFCLLLPLCQRACVCVCVWVIFFGSVFIYSYATNYIVKVKKKSPSRMQTKQKHQRQQCAEWCQQMSTLWEWDSSVGRWDRE